MTTIESLSRLVDEATAAYILETRKSFEDLQQVASQLAGMLVLAAAGSKEAAPDHPALISARQIFRSAEDALHLARPTERARRHHELLVKAAKRIGVALKLAVSALDIDGTIVFLRAGYAELERAADALPGFEKVSYERACCVGGRAQ
jgi:hypothetical protein